MQKLLNIYLNIKPIAYQKQKVKGSKVVTFNDIVLVNSSKEISTWLVQDILKMPFTRKTRLSIPYFLLKLPKIDLSSLLEVYLNKGS